MLLRATHIKTGESLTFELKQPGEYSLGRATADDEPAKLAVPFDRKLSRRHARLKISAKGLRVSRDGSRYPLFFGGEESDQFWLLAGQRFSSAETLFELLESHPSQAQTSFSLTLDGLEEANRRNADKVLEVLLGLQPILGGYEDIEELFFETQRLLSDLLPTATVGLYRVLTDHETVALARDTGWPPSRTLLAQSLQQKGPVFHLFEEGPGTGCEPTAYGGASWALAAPVISGAGTYLLYATGSENSESDRGLGTPGELDRAALALIARVLAQHLEGRRAAVLAARIEAERRAIEASKLSAVGQLAAGMAHELNTPLATVKLGLDYALMKTDKESKVGQRLQKAAGELRRAHKLVEQLLSYTREGAKRQQVSLRKLVEDTLALVVKQFGEKGTPVRLELADAGEVTGSPHELQQLLLNLLLNARDAVREAGSSDAIEVVARGRSLEVRDRGVGLPQEHLDRIFEPFFTTKPVGKGAGLGLSIARNIAESHQGKLEALSREGGGAVFRLTFD